MRVPTKQLVTMIGLMAAAPAFGQSAANHTFQAYDGAGNPIAPVTINGSGATLFVDFFRAQASTNDFIDVDNDGTATGSGFFIDQLAPNVTLGNNINWDDSPASSFEDQSYWLFQYRSVGSTNGFQEFVNYQATRPGTGAVAQIPTTGISENGLINRAEWADQDGLITYGPDAGNNTASTGIGTVYGNASGTPYAPTKIDFSLTDVPTKHVVGKLVNPSDSYSDPNAIAAAEAVATWNALPGQAGYGFNPIQSGPTAGGTGGGFGNQLASLEAEGNPANSVVLNQNTVSPDANTIFDTPMTFGPMGYIANHGTGLTSQDNAGNTVEGGIRVTEMQHAFTTGRMLTGENLAVVVRDSGSGTRNAAMNTIGVDPSWGRGDNDGSKVSTSDTEKLGDDFQVAHKGGSSRMEGTVQNHRLAIGYTGLSGGSRAAADNRGGRYEVLSILRDVDTGDVGEGTTFVLPSAAAIVDNLDPDTGYAYGGNVAISTLGNPLAGKVDYNNDGDFLDPGEDFGIPSLAEDPINGDPTVADAGVRDYIRNIYASVLSFTSVPNKPADELMPGEYLADTFFLQSGMQAVSNDDNPDNFQDNTAGQNLALANFMKTNNDFDAGGDPLAWGSGGSAGTFAFGRVPQRLESGSYADGTNDNTGNYRYRLTPGGAVQTINGGAALNEANGIAGDFNQDGKRTIGDIAKMVEAAQAPDLLDWAASQSAFGSDAGALAGNVVLPHIIGDFDGNGNFDSEDVRYFADGLALSTTAGLDVIGDSTIEATLNRKDGFTAVDNAASGNFFGTTLATGKSYVNGDSRGDITGPLGLENMGGAPSGADGIIDAFDIDYIYAQFMTNDGVTDGHANWLDINEAVYFDLSADMTGDLIVNQLDVDDLVLNILGTSYGDVNLDGTVDTADEGIVTSNLGLSGLGWAGGDLNGDGTTDALDQAFFGGITGDLDGDGFVGIDDLNLVLANWNQNVPPANPLADPSGDGFIGIDDLNEVLGNWNAGTPPNAAANIPEPASLALIGMGAAAMLKRNKR